MTSVRERHMRTLRLATRGSAGCCPSAPTPSPLCPGHPSPTAIVSGEKPIAQVVPATVYIIGTLKLVIYEYC